MSGDIHTYAEECERERKREREREREKEVREGVHKDTQVVVVGEVLHELLGEDLVLGALAGARDVHVAQRRRHAGGSAGATRVGGGSRARKRVRERKREREGEEERERERER